MGHTQIYKLRTATLPKTQILGAIKIAEFLNGFGATNLTTRVPSHATSSVSVQGKGSSSPSPAARWPDLTARLFRVEEYDKNRSSFQRFQLLCSLLLMNDPNISGGLWSCKSDLWAPQPLPKLCCWAAHAFETRLQPWNHVGFDKKMVQLVSSSPKNWFAMLVVKRPWSDIINKKEHHIPRKIGVSGTTDSSWTIQLQQ